MDKDDLPGVLSYPDGWLEDQLNYWSEAACMAREQRALAAHGLTIEPRAVPHGLPARFTEWLTMRRAQRLHFKGFHRVSRHDKARFRENWKDGRIDESTGQFTHAAGVAIMGALG